MASMINTNIASLNAQNNLSKSSMSLTTALQRLSSGLRINSAKDDAAGLAISERMNAQVGGLNQAARNANDAISLSQTAEGALSGMGDNLQRLRTLAVQAANSTNSDSDRQTIQAEVSQLVSEIGRVAATTEFNGIKLLDGSFKAQSFQVGANSNQTIAVSVDSAQTSKLGASQASAVTATNNGNALVAGDLTLNGISVGGSSAASDTASTASASASAIAKVAAINAVSAQTGVSAKADANEVGGANMTIAAVSGTLVVNGIATGTITTGGVDADADRNAVINAINLLSSQTGVSASNGGSTAAGVKLTAADGRNIAVTATGALTSAATGVAGVGAGTTNFGKFTLTSSSTIAVTGSATNLLNAGVQAGSFATQTAFASTTSGIAAKFTAQDFKLNGVLIGDSLISTDTASSVSKDFSAISKAAAINAISSQTGVTATANVNAVDGASQTAVATGASTLTVNGVATGSISLVGTGSTDRTTVINAINAISGQTGVTASDGGTSLAGIKLSAADGRNINVSTSGTSLTGGAAGNTGLAAFGTNFATFTLNSAKAFTVEAGTTGVTTGSIAMLAQGTYGAGRSGQALSTIDVSTATGANAAIVAIDNAITSLNSSRANLGAIQNRFASTISTLQSTSENLTAARSRITDADFASETANLTRGQILQQAGTAMLAQANGLPNGVLALLR